MSTNLAFKRIQIIKAIVRAERQRAESYPEKQRNLDLGIVDPSSSKHNKKQISEVFNDLEIFLDHLHVSHVAAAFEALAKSKMSRAAGEVSEIASSPHQWRKALVKDAASFSNLNEIGKLIIADYDTSLSFSSIRKIRNKFDHGERLSAAPDVGPGEAFALLEQVLETIQ